MAILAPYIPLMYNTTDEVRTLASSFIITVAVSAPIQAILNASYFTLRSGGKVYSGKGISTDIVGASIHAYLSALNKIVYEEAEA